MSIFAAFLASWALPESLSLLKNFAALSLSIHDFCLLKLSNSEHAALNSALFCGKTPESLAMKRLYIESGLFHLLVVSGSHLSFLEKVLQRLLGARLSKWLVPPVLFAFALMSNWQPPVVRAFFESMSRLGRREPARHVFDSWLWCLALHPSWILSSSLLLSVTARLALVPKLQNEAQRALLIFALLLPLLAGWSVSNPWLALIGVVLAPPSLALWFLIGAVELVVPSGWGWLTEMNRVWEALLAEAGTLAPPVIKLTSHARLWGPFYVMLIFLSLHAWSVRAKRRAP